MGINCNIYSPSNPILSSLLICFLPISSSPFNSPFPASSVALIVPHKIIAPDTFYWSWSFAYHLAYKSALLSVCLSVRLSLCLSIRQLTVSVFLSACRSVSLSVCPSTACLCLSARVRLPVSLFVLESVRSYVDCPFSFFLRTIGFIPARPIPLCLGPGQKRGQITPILSMINQNYTFRPKSCIFGAFKFSPH